MHRTPTGFTFSRFDFVQSVVGVLAYTTRKTHQKGVDTYATLEVYRKQRTFSNFEFGIVPGTAALCSLYLLAVSQFVTTEPVPLQDETSAQPLGTRAG